MPDAEPVLRTDRLLVREWTQDDAERVLDIQSRWEVVRWLDDDATVMADLAEARDRIEGWRAIPERDGPPCGHWAIEVRETGVVAGAVMLVPMPPLNRPEGVREVQVGWHLHPDSTGHGYAREAAAAAVAYGLGRGLPVVRALMYVDNEPSARVARAIGMAQQPTVTDQWYPGDSLVFVATPDSEVGATLR